MGADPRPSKPTGTLQYLVDLGKRVFDLDIRTPERRRMPPRRRPTVVRPQPPQPADRIIDLDAPASEPPLPSDLDEQREESHRRLDALYNRALELQGERSEEHTSELQSR